MYTADNYRYMAKEYRTDATNVLSDIIRKEKLLSENDLSAEDRDNLQEEIRLLQDVYDDLIGLEQMMLNMSKKVDGNYSPSLYEM